MKNQRLVEALSEIDDNCNTIEQRRAFRQLCESLDNNKTTVQPKDERELVDIIKNTIEEQGNQCDLNFIDTSKIKDMNYLFSKSDNGYGFGEFDGDISKWDVSNVTDMRNMFLHSIFDGDISKWDVSKVKTMRNMFSSAKIGCDLSNWNTENASKFQVFYKAKFYKPYKKPEWAFN